MMGDRDYRQTIKNAIETLGKEVKPKIDPNDNKTIYVHEVVRCLRRSYFDRVDPLEPLMAGFSNLISGLLRKMQSSSSIGEFSLENIKLKGQADIIVDDVIMIFRSAEKLPESPFSQDILYLNTCLWIFDKVDGIIVYITGDGKETSYSLTKQKKMFEETVRRIRVLNNLLDEQKTPILEPSSECTTCQYFERCFVKRKIGRSLSLHDLLGTKES